MKIAVVTPWHSAKPEWFAQCLDSVRAQTQPCTHIVVSDGAGRPPLPADFEGQLIELPQNHADSGDTPRAVGSEAAIAQGFDAIAYLDDDNWYHPQHLQSLALAHTGTRAAICSSARWLHALNGQRLARCPDIDARHFVDTNCYFLTAQAFALCRWWREMPARFHPMGDRFIWGAAHQLCLSHAYTAQPSVHYRSKWAPHYRLAGVPVPAGVTEYDPQMEALVADLVGYFQRGEWH